MYPIATVTDVLFIEEKIADEISLGKICLKIVHAPPMNMASPNANNVDLLISFLSKM
jgi:hypothetical protein